VTLDYALVDLKIVSCRDTFSRLIWAFGVLYAVLINNWSFVGGYDYTVCGDTQLLALRLHCVGGAFFSLMVIDSSGLQF